MKPNRNIRYRWILSILYGVIGISLIACNLFHAVDDYWSGMGAALLVIGVLQVLRLIRYKSDPQYKEATDTAVNDERNRFLSTKAWSWAGYLYIMIAAVGSIVFKLLDQEALMFAASGSVCIILVLYWISYLIVRKKY
ncbi:MAG: hypothetical protein IJB36_02020 [Clostridia bacterium]|nr:hypothetical protein [Clostridia bacterium]